MHPYRIFVFTCIIQSARVCLCLRAYHYLFGFEHFGIISW